VGNCVAVGSYVDSANHYQAMVATEVGGTFGRATEVTLPPNAGSNPAAGLSGVSCVSVGNCVAVGSYGDGSGRQFAMAASETGGIFGRATQVSFPPNVYTHAYGTLFGVSCTSVGNCVAVGGYNDSSGNNQAMEATETDGVFGQAFEVSPPLAQAYLAGVSCTSTGNCVAVGSYRDPLYRLQPLEVTEAGGTFKREIWTAPSNAASNPYAALSGVSCTSADNCLAVGHYLDSFGSDSPGSLGTQEAMAATESGGTFEQATEVIPAPKGGWPELSGVSCISASDCVAVGDYTDSSGDIRPMAAGDLLPPCPTGIRHLASGPQAAMAATESKIDGRSCPGDWIVNRAGQITAIGAAPWLGDLTGLRLNAPIVAITATSDHGGYWLLGRDGGVFSFGDAHFYGSTGNIRLNQPVVGIAAAPGGRGYWLVAADGGVFSFGDAHFYGSTGNIHLNQPVVGMSSTPTGGGYWLVASDGGVFTFGNASFIGSLGDIALAAPIIGMTPQPSATGYRLVGSDGGVFDFGDARYYGSLPAEHVADPGVTAISSSLTGNGYYLLNSQGTIWAFGDAPDLGNA
jgi:hypothetical protein